MLNDSCNECKESAVIPLSVICFGDQSKSFTLLNVVA